MNSNVGIISEVVWLYLLKILPMKLFMCIAGLLITSPFFSQTDAELMLDIETYQNEESEKFKDPETTILDSTSLASFEALHYYPINLKFRVEARFVRTPDEKPFLMPTTTARLPEYVKYGEAHFTIDGQELVLNLYRDTSDYDDPELVDYLFLPFTDLTSGDGSYGGGRFIDSKIPNGETIVIDFNRAYNPYCAYNSRYSCPIPPEENDLLIRIEAGVKDFGHH